MPPQTTALIAAPDEDSQDAEPDQADSAEAAAQNNPTVDDDTGNDAPIALIVLFAAVAGGFGIWALIWQHRRPGVVDS